MANKYDQLAKAIVEAVGGKANITSVTHCMTRLRFTLKDNGVPDQEKIKKMDGVMGIVLSGGQFQIVIGQNVPKVYSEVCSLVGVAEQKQISDPVNGPKEKLTLKKVGANIMDYLSGSITPLIPIMLGAAMFKTIQIIFGSSMLGWIEDGSNLAVLLDFVYDAGYYFFPIYLGYTAAKKLNSSIPLGMFLGGVLLVPDFRALMDADKGFSILGIPCAVNDYSSTVVPILLSVWVMHYLYNLIKKYMPDVLSTVFTPFCTMAIMLPISLCLLAPLGNYIGQYVAEFLNWFAGVGGGVAVGLVAAAYSFLVIVGMHSPIVVMALTTLFSTGSDTLVFVGAGCATAASCGVAFGAFLKLRDRKEKSLSAGYLMTGLLSGVTEPILYGIGVKYKRPFLGQAIGALVGGLYAGFTHVTFHALISVTVLAPLCYTAGGTVNMVNGTISVVLSFVVAALVVFFFGFTKEDLTVQNAEGANE